MIKITHIFFPILTSKPQKAAIRWILTVLTHGTIQAIHVEPIPKYWAELFAKI
jgi:hypothetical protein